MKKILAVTGIIVVGFFLFLGIRLYQFYTRIYLPAEVEKKPPVVKSAYNILLLGYAGGVHEGTYLTDTLIVLHLDLAKKAALLVSLPRDLWVDLPTRSGAGFSRKINTLYSMELFPAQFPDVETKNLSALVVGRVTGLRIDYFASVNFTGFVRVIDILGGVDVQVERGFEDKRYPVEGKEKDLCGKEEKDLPELEKIATESPELAFPCRYETLRFAPGQQHMDGETALKYVRSRYAPEDGGDFARASRQQRFLEAARDKVLTVGFLPKIIPLLDELEEHIKTDIPASILQKFLTEARRASEYTVRSFVISDDNFLKHSRSEDGQFILIPKTNYQQIHQGVRNALSGRLPAPTVK